LEISNSHIRANTKVSKVEYQNISYWVQKYIIFSTKIYFRSSTKICKT